MGFYCPLFARHFTAASATYKYTSMKRGKKNSAKLHTRSFCISELECIETADAATDSRESVGHFDACSFQGVILASCPQSALHNELWFNADFFAKRFPGKPPLLFSFFRTLLFTYRQDLYISHWNLIYRVNSPQQINSLPVASSICNETRAHFSNVIYRLISLPFCKCC